MTKQATINIETEARQLGQIWNKVEINRSIKLYQNASENWKKLTNLEKSAFCLRETAKLSLIVANYKISRQALKQSLLLDNKTGNLEGQIISNSLLSRLEGQIGHIEKSKRYYERAIYLSSSSTNTARAYAHNAAGEFAFDKNTFDEALTNFKVAYSFADGTKETELKANILLNLGTVNAIKGNFEIGLDQIRLAQYLWRNIDNKRGLAYSYNRVGFVYAISDEKQKAFDNYKKAGSLFPQDVDFPEKAKLHSGLGKIYLEYNRFDLAEINYLKALKYFEKAKMEIGQLAIIPELFHITNLKGKKDLSNKLYQRALLLSKKLNNKFILAIIYQRAGQIDFANSNYDKALIKFSKSNLIFTKLDVKMPLVKNSLGKTYEKKGDLDKALKYYEMAFREGRQTQEVVQIGESLYNLANLNLKEGKLDLALGHSTEALEITESIYKDVDNHNLRQSFFSNSFDRYELHINILMKMHELFPNDGYELKALQTSEKLRSRLMRENLKFSTVDQILDADPQLVEKEKEFSLLLSVKKTDLSNLLDQKNSAEKVGKLTDEIAQIDDQLETIKSALRETSPIYSLIKHSNEFDYSEFQNKILDDKTVLIEFFFGKEKSYVWLIEKNNISVLELPKCKYINNQLEDLLNVMQSVEEVNKDDIAKHQKQLVEIEKQYWKDASSLSNLLFGDFADKIKDKKLIIVPDGKLLYFPISALPVPNDSDNTPLLLTNEIVYEPSASMLYLLKTSDQNNSIPQKDFLVYSDPIFTKDDDRITNPIKLFKEDTLADDNAPIWNDEGSISELARLTRLDASDEEASNIFQYFDISNSNIINGFDANRQNFLTENLSDYKVLHFATHGLLNEEHSELSGIVLSQFDEKGNKRNGFIWLQDIYGLKLSTDLVVLSACHTGIGEDIKGEGLMSLTNGFLQVGAKSVISSHWKVNDEATVVLMNDFYEILSNEGISTSAALHKAQIKMYKNPNYKFPYYWASFTFHGDFQNKPNLNTNFKYSKLVFLTIFALTILGIFFFIKNVFD